MNFDNLFHGLPGTFTITNRNFVLTVLKLNEVSLIFVGAARENGCGVAIAFVDDFNCAHVHALQAGFALKLNEVSMH